MDLNKFLELLEKTKTEILNIDYDKLKYLNPRLKILNSSILESIKHIIENSDHYKKYIDTLEQFFLDYYPFTKELNDPAYQFEGGNPRFGKILNNLYEYYHGEIVEIIGRVRDKINILKLDVFSKELEKLEAQNESLNKKLSETESLRNSLAHQLEEQTKRYESTNTNLELEKQEDTFEKIAKNYKANAKWWLAGIISSILILVYLIFHIKKNFCFDISCYDSIELTSYNTICENCGEHLLWLEIFKSIFFRILIISINIYLLTFCIRNYNASMHNKTINELRQNSFAAALHFYNTTTGDKKDEILLKAADSIFSHRATGYQGKNSEPQTSFIQNIVDKVNPSK